MSAFECTINIEYRIIGGSRGAFNCRASGPRGARHHCRGDPRRVRRENGRYRRRPSQQPNDQHLTGGAPSQLCDIPSPRASADQARTWRARAEDDACDASKSAASRSVRRAIHGAGASYQHLRPRLPCRLLRYRGIDRYIFYQCLTSFSNLFHH